MAKIKAKLRALDLRGESVHTRWGHVLFDRDGLSELEVEESELDMLRALRWLVEAPQPQPVQELPPNPTPEEPTWSAPLGEVVEKPMSVSVSEKAATLPPPPPPPPPVPRSSRR